MPRNPGRGSLTDSEAARAARAYSPSAGVTVKALARRFACSEPVMRAALEAQGIAIEKHPGRGSTSS